MGILTRFLPKKKQEETECQSLLEKLDCENIIYDLEENENGFTLIYTDALDSIKFYITSENDQITVNGTPKTEEEVLQILKEQNKLDNRFYELMDLAEFEPAFHIYHSFFDIMSLAGITSEIGFDENGNLLLTYLKGKKSDQQHKGTVIAGLRIMKEEPNEVFLLPDEKPVRLENAVLSVLELLYKENPLGFDSGKATVPENNPYSDVIKAHLLNIRLIDRLNEVKNVEAKLITLNGNSIIFILFRNGAALEYISATKQNTSGRIMIIDIDEDTTLEYNEEYWLVRKILKIPELLGDKPDENKMPVRNFTRAGKEIREVKKK